MTKRSPTFLSLFSGCGGLDLGFEQAGFVSLGSYDIDEAALTVHRTNLEGPAYKLDLTTLDPTPESNKRVDVLMAGSPCQGFSTLGPRKLEDPRNSLLLVAPRIARKLNPRIVIAENVPGAIAGKHKIYWDRLHDELRGMNYKTTDLHLNSMHFGVAQNRTRIILVAWKTKKEVEFYNSVKHCSLADVLTSIDNLPNHNPVLIDPKSNDFKIALRIKQGQKLTNARGGDRSVHTWEIPEVFGRTNAKERIILETVLKLRRQIRRRDYGDADPVCETYLTNLFDKFTINKLVEKGFLRREDDHIDLTNTFNGKYRRQHISGVSRTVDTRFGDYRLFLHPTEHRGFTVREAARIQGFPDKFIFSGTLTQQFRMIGNAVPPPLALGLANYIKNLT